MDVARSQRDAIDVVRSTFSAFLGVAGRRIDVARSTFSPRLGATGGRGEVPIEVPVDVPAPACGGRTGTEPAGGVSAYSGGETSAGRVCVPASAASTGLLVSLATHPGIVCYPLLAARLRRRGT